MTTLAEAQAAARRLHYPVTLTLDDATAPVERAGIANGRALARAWREMEDAPAQQKRRRPAAASSCSARHRRA